MTKTAVCSHDLCCEEQHAQRYRSHWLLSAGIVAKSQKTALRSEPWTQIYRARFICRTGLLSWSFEWIKYRNPFNFHINLNETKWKWNAAPPPLEIHSPDSVPPLHFQPCIQLYIIAYILGMCNSDRVLEYSAVTAMIDHENDDREKIILIGYSSTLGGTLTV